MSDVLIVKNLNRWFKEKWVDVSRKDKDGKHPPCGRSKAKKGSKGYPKCRPSVKVSSKPPKTSGEMTSGQKRAATKRKRSKKQGVGGKPTIVKSPMEIAMQLLKMPITSDSPEIKQLDSGPAHIHQFQDPVTGEVKPLYISPASNPDSENLYAGIIGDNGDRASAKFNTGDGDYASLDGVETQEPYRRRGYMSAIYDAMDEYLEQNKKGRRLVPSNFQSDEGKAFWESRKKSEPMDIAMRLLKAKYLDENLNNVLYGEQDPVAQPVVEEPPHVHSIEGDNELKRRQRQQAMTSFSPLVGMVNQINPHTNQDRITELKQQEEENVVVGDKRSGSELFPISSMPPKYREDLTPDEQYEDYYSRSWLARPDRVKPQELNDEARERFPLKFTGEPMDIAWRLLKDAVSPEAKRHKLEYDKKYESTPERVKYREELNRERRKRGIYGHGGPDMSHTKDHTLVAESPHANRARHFKERGTLKG